MSEKTHNRLVERLVNEIKNHSHKNELLRLILLQLADDSLG